MALSVQEAIGLLANAETLADVEAIASQLSASAQSIAGASRGAAVFSGGGGGRRRVPGSSGRNHQGRGGKIRWEGNSSYGPSALDSAGLTSPQASTQYHMPTRR